MGYNPNILFLQVGYNTFTNHLLTSWDIQVPCGDPKTSTGTAVVVDFIAGSAAVSALPWLGAVQVLQQLQERDMEFRFPTWWQR